MDSSQFVSKKPTASDDEEYPISGDPSKYVTLPVQNEKIWRKYQNTLEWFWTVYDIYLANDKDNMISTFDEEQRHCILQLLGLMFTTHHTTINKELFMDFMNQVEIKEATYYFGSQADSKKTHCLMYSMLIEELTRNDPELDKTKLVTEILNCEYIRDFLKWSIHNTTSNSYSFSHRLLTFATLQGIIFGVPFLAFKWIHKQNPSKMPGLANSNDLIWRDESLNLSFTCMLFEYLGDDDFTEQEAQRIIKEAVGHAKRIFTQQLPLSKLGLEQELIGQYIEYLADRILSDIGLSKIYLKESPFDWVEEPKTETFQNKNMNNVMDFSTSFGEAKFDTEIDF